LPTFFFIQGKRLVYYHADIKFRAIIAADVRKDQDIVQYSFELFTSEIIDDVYSCAGPSGMDLSSLLANPPTAVSGFLISSATLP